MSNADFIETSKSIFGLVELLKQIEEEQKTMTEEEKKKYATHNHTNQGSQKKQRWKRDS